MDNVTRINLDDFKNNIWKVKRYKFINHVEAWQVLFENYPKQADFAELDVVEEILDVLGNMDGMEAAVWDYIKEKLFEQSMGTARWMGLDYRFGKIRAALCIPDTGKAACKKKDKLHLKRCVASWVYGEDTPIYEKYERQYRIYGMISKFEVLMMLLSCFVRIKIVPWKRK